MLNLEDVKKLALAAIASKPEGREYVYSNPADDGPKCLNVHEVAGVKVPGCIVGNMLSQVVGIDKVPDWGGVGSTLKHTGIEVSQDAKEFMIELQSRQDNGVSWGRAFDGALAWLSSDDDCHTT